MRILLSTLVLAVAVAVGAITPAGATFAAPVDVTSDLLDAASSPQVAMTASGEAMVAWNHGNLLRARSLTAGVLGPLRSISTGGFDPATHSRVAINDSGDAAFTWQIPATPSVVWGRIWAADGTLGPAKKLSIVSADASEPEVAMTAAGTAIFTWTQADGGDQRIESRVLSAGGALGPLQRLSARGQDASSPEVGVDDAGRAIFVWTRSDGAHTRVQSLARTATGTLGPVQNLTGAGQDASSPRLAVTPDGRAVFTWRFGISTVQTVARTVAGNLSPVQNLVSVGTPADPQVAVDDAGDAVFAWTRANGSHRQVEGRARSVAGVLSAVQKLSGFGETATLPRVAVDSTGDAVFAWTLTGPPSVVQARERAADGSLFAVQTVAASDSGENAEDGTLAVDGDGDALVAWSEVGAKSKIQAAAGP